MLKQEGKLGHWISKKQGGEGLVFCGMDQTEI
jgi:hypothetical protein